MPDIRYDNFIPTYILQNKEMTKLSKRSLSRLILAALFTALTCVCTMAIPIPTPTGGYVHPGDCFVILAGVFLGPVLGGLAGGIGSMLSDLFLGYMVYVPATFVIKFLAAFTVGSIFVATRSFTNSFAKKNVVFIASGICSSIIVIIGYFLFEWLLTSNALSAAISGITGNIAQGIASIIFSTLLYHVLERIMVSLNMTTQIQK